MFSRFDAICVDQGIYKVETLGDCYLACTGLLVESDDHAEQLLRFAKAILVASRAVRNPATGGDVQLRVGIHSGRVMVSELYLGLPRRG